MKKVLQGMLSAAVLAALASLLSGCPSGEQEQAATVEDLYVISHLTNEVLRYDGGTGAPKGAFVTSGAGGLNAPFDLLFGPDGNLYVASRLTNQVLRYNGSTGAFIDVFVDNGEGGLNVARAMVFDADSNLYVTSWGSDEVLRYDAAGAPLSAFVAAGAGGLDAPFGLAFKPAD